MGDGNGESPLKTITQDLERELNIVLNEDNITVHMAMRYQQPLLDKVLAEMQQENYDKIIVLPLFPHYASSSSGSAIQRALEIISKWWVIPELQVINQFYDASFYVKTLAEQARKHDPSSFDHIIMSYHGLPERHVDKVYDGLNLCADHSCETVLDSDNKFLLQSHFFETSRLIAEELGLAEEEYTVAFQSRLDNKWLTPFSDEAAEEFAKRATSGC